MKSNYAANGRGGGIALVRPLRRNPRTGEVLRGGGSPRREVAPAQEGARTELPLRTGRSVSSPEMTHDIIDGLPAPLRWAACVLLALTMAGVTPALAASALLALCDATGGWVALALAAGAVAIVLRAI